MMRLSLFIAVLQMLSGCAPSHSAPARTVEVKLPVPEECAAGDVEEPPWKLARLSPGATSVQMLEAELGDLELARGYILELKAEFAGCD